MNLQSVKQQPTFQRPFASSCPWMVASFHEGLTTQKYCKCPCSNYINIQSTFPLIPTLTCSFLGKSKTLDGNPKLPDIPHQCTNLSITPVRYHSSQRIATRPNCSVRLPSRLYNFHHPLSVFFCLLLGSLMSFVATWNDNEMSAYDIIDIRDPWDHS